MKLTKTTLSLLKNCAEVNNNLLIRPGKALRTMTMNKSVLMEAFTEEEFDKEVAIYDLKQFLNCVELLGSPEVEFAEEAIILSCGNRSTHYLYSTPDVVCAPPDKQLVLPSEDVIFTLTESNLKALRKAAQVLQKQDLAVIGDGKGITLSIFDKKAHSNTFDIELYGEKTDKSFQFNIRVDKLNHLLSGDYQVMMSKSNISKWVSTKRPVHYFVALEPDSSWDLSNETATPEKVKVNKKELAAV
jgi:predicted lipoprotein with Yx(FWY)xxD motif